MLGDLLVDFYREVKVDYKDNDIDKTKYFYVKGLSLKDLGELFADQSVGVVLLKAIEGIDLKKEDNAVVTNIFQKLIDSKYDEAVYKLIAQCLYLKDEHGNHLSCKKDWHLLDKIPFHITTKFLSNIVELTLPSNEGDLRTEIKKLIRLLTSKAEK